MWDPDCLSVDSVVKNHGFLIVTGSLKCVDEKVNLVNVYAPNDHLARRQLWANLLEVRLNCPGMWVLMGDFNDVRRSDERFNSRFDPVAAEFFNDFIFRAGLLEYRMTGGSFTFISDNTEVKMSKLDRFLVCDRFWNRWPEASSSVIPKGPSDHCPIVLSCISLDFGPIPFKFFNSWIGSSELNGIMAEAANTTLQGSCADLKLAFLLKEVKEKIKLWRKAARASETVVLEALAKVDIVYV
jgi:hypothetical protein